MGSLGENLPKALVPLAGKPILEHQLDLAHRYGFEEIILLTGHLGDLIKSHLRMTATAAWTSVSIASRPRWARQAH